MNIWGWRRRRTPKMRPAPPTDAVIRSRAREVVEGSLSRDAFLGWLHDAVYHDGPDKYLDLVEMGCVPEEADAGEGRWWRESEEARPLRDWTDRAIAAVARDTSPEGLPEGWDDPIWRKSAT